MIRILGALAALLLLAAACGSDEGDFRDQMRALDFEDETIDCMIDELGTRGLSVGDISDSAIGDGNLPAGAQDAITVCLTQAFPTDLPTDTGDGATSDGSDTGDGVTSDGSETTPGTYGSDARLDALWDSCEAGDGEACDDLYFQSPVGSEYELYGDTCGARFEESPGFCAAALS